MAHDDTWWYMLNWKQLYQKNVIFESLAAALLSRFQRRLGRSLAVRCLHWILPWVLASALFTSVEAVRSFPWWVAYWSTRQIHIAWYSTLVGGINPTFSGKCWYIHVIHCVRGVFRRDRNLSGGHEFQPWRYQGPYRVQRGYGGYGFEHKAFRDTQHPSGEGETWR